MIFWYLIKLPLNLLIEFIRWAERLNDRNSLYLEYLVKEFLDRIKRLKD